VAEKERKRSSGKADFREFSYNRHEHLTVLHTKKLRERERERKKGGGEKSTK